jgi:hypothetical protein
MTVVFSMKNAWCVAYQGCDDKIFTVTEWSNKFEYWLMEILENL